MTRPSGRRRPPASGVWPSTCGSSAGSSTSSGRGAEMPNPAPANSVRDLPPNIFAIVMATGIVALAMNAAGWPAGGRVLFWVGLAAYGVLWVLTAARCARHWSAVRADLTAHAKAPGFFTVVAGTGVLGSGCVLLHDALGAGTALWLVALALWV